MSEDQFTKLFKYMERRFDAVDKAHAELRAEFKTDIHRLYDLIDQILKNQETDEQERLAANNQLDRHEGWIKQLAEGSKTKLIPEP